MDSLSLAALGIAISLCVGGLLLALMLGPVRSVLRRNCPSADGVLFGTRFTVVMLLLGPVLCTLMFGVPVAERALSAAPSDLIVRVLTASLVGSFLTLGAIGIRIGTLKPPPSPSTPALRKKTDDEFIR